MRKKRGRKNVSIPIFVLVPQVKLPKKLSLLAAADAAQGALAGLILSQWRDDEGTK